MSLNSKRVLAIITSGIWINASEFIRNQFLLKNYWIEHYKSLGMVFPSEPKNGMMWILWGFLFAVAIFIISRKFSLLQTTLLCWFMGFLLMWIVIGNLNVLPSGILVDAVPLSLLEVFVGAFICKKMMPVQGGA